MFDFGSHRTAVRFADKDEVLGGFCALPPVDHERYRADLKALVDRESSDRDEQ